MVLKAYTSQKEAKVTNETHLFARNLRFQRGEVGAGEMDATCVAGGISGRVLFFGVGARQIGIFAARLRRRIKNPASYAGWTRRVLINLDMTLKLNNSTDYLRCLREFSTEMLSFILVW